MDLVGMLAELARDSREQHVRTMTATVLPGGNLRYDTDIDDAAPVTPTDSLAGTPAVGSRVLCLIDRRRVIILGPSATTLEARLAQLEARLARLPYRVAHGQWVEPDPGPTSSFVRFPPGALFTAPPTVVCQLASTAGVYAGAQARVDQVGTTGFRLTTVGTAVARCPWNWTAIQ